jgi:hypothetical protein
MILLSFDGRTWPDRLLSLSVVGSAVLLGARIVRLV